MDDYQRNYVWGKLECDNFFKSIKMTVYKRKKCSDDTKKYIHYLGELKFVQVDSSTRGNKYSVVDGQQRLTTAILLLIALRDTFPEKRFVDDINRCLVCGTDPKIDPPRFKLKEVFSDNSTLERLIRGRKQRNLAVSHVLEIYQYFCSILKNEFNKYDLLLDQSDISVEDLFYEGLKQLKMTYILLEPDVNPGENPQWTFENSNSMGKPLRLGDLVCNLLISGSETVNERRLCYADEWLPMARSLGDDLDIFVRDYIQIKTNKKMPAAEPSNTSILFHIFKTQFGFMWDADQDTCKRIISEMADYSVPYLVVTKGELDQGYDKNDKTMMTVMRILNDIRPFGLLRLSAFLTKIVNMYMNDEIEGYRILGILEAIKTYKLRCALNHNSKNESQRLQFRLLEMIPSFLVSDNTEALALEILFTFSTFRQYPNDETINNNLIEEDFYHKTNSRHILIMIEEALSKNRPDADDSTLQIEHIMPQKLTDEWVANLKEWEKTPISTHQKLVHTLGNLTLIRHNQELGQKTFSEKQKLFDETAGLAMARKGIKNCRKWGADEIAARTKELAKVFLEQVAPLPKKLQERPAPAVTSKAKPSPAVTQMFLDIFKNEVTDDDTED